MNKNSKGITVVWMLIFALLITGCFNNQHTQSYESDESIDITKFEDIQKARSYLGTDKFEEKVESFSKIKFMSMEEFKTILEKYDDNVDDCYVYGDARYIYGDLTSGYLLALVHLGKYDEYNAELPQLFGKCSVNTWDHEILTSDLFTDDDYRFLMSSLEKHKGEKPILTKETLNQFEQYSAATNIQIYICIKLKEIDKMHELKAELENTTQEWEDFIKKGY